MALNNTHYYFTVSGGQESRSSLAVWFWLGVSHAIVFSCGTELQASQGSAGAENLLASLLMWLLAWGCRCLPRRLLHGAAHDVGYPRREWPSRLGEPKTVSYHLILEEIFHHLCRIPDFRPLQYCWATWQSPSEHVLALMGKCPAAARDTRESSGVREPSPFHLCPLPEATSALQPLHLAECKDPPQHAAYPSPTWQVRGRDPVIWGTDEQPHLWAKPRKPPRNGTVPRSPHYPKARCLWSTGMGGMQRWLNVKTLL